MKILHVADLHYDLKKFDWVVDVAPEVDLLVMAGDHLEIANQIKRPAQAVVIRKYFQRINRLTKLVVSSGNHDLDEKDEFGDMIAKWVSNIGLFGIATDGDTLEFNNTLISVFPWWSGRNLQFDVSEQLERDAKRQAGSWIWIHHAPPENSPTSWDGRNCYGIEELRQWIADYQPTYVLSGHIHQSPYVNDGSWVDRIGATWIFNGGHQPGRVPSHVLIDTELNRAFWKSAYGAEYVKLDGDLKRPAAPLTDPPEWVMAMDRWANPRPA